MRASRCLTAALWLAVLVVMLAAPGGRPAGRALAAGPQQAAPLLSPYWGPEIQRWAGTIGALSQSYGFHPDFIAAVIHHESDGRSRPLSRFGALGLMAMNPAGAAAEWRPSSEALLHQTADLRWGMSILSYVVQETGGDLFTALAAYSGGWQHVNSRMPREYAARVLDSYARALLVRAGLSPDSAARWTVAVDLRAGNVPEESLLVLGQKPIARLHTLARHTVYAFSAPSGLTFHVSGYVVPVGLSELVVSESGYEHPDELEAPLRARLGEKSAGGGNPRVLLACLAGLERLRGQVTTRWYGPSACPAGGR